MTDKQIKKYCDGLDCDICNEKEPCIYKIANELEEKLLAKERQNKDLREDIKDIANLLDLDTDEEYNFGNIEIAIKDLRQECKKAKNIIKEALSDFCGEIGTKEYTKLTKEAKELGIEVKDYE